MEQRILPDLPLEPVMDQWVLGEPDKGDQPPPPRYALYRPGFFPYPRVIDKSIQGCCFCSGNLVWLKCYWWLVHHKRPEKSLERRGTCYGSAVGMDTRVLVLERTLQN